MSRPVAANASHHKVDLAMITVVAPGHIRCELCGTEVTWSGGSQVPEAGLTRSESIAAYLHFADHACTTTD